MVAKFLRGGGEKVTSDDGRRFAGLYWLHFMGVIQCELAIDRQLTPLLTGITCGFNHSLSENDCQALRAWWSQVNRLLAKWGQKPIEPVDNRDLLHCIRQLSKLIFLS